VERVPTPSVPMPAPIAAFTSDAVVVDQHVEHIGTLYFHVARRDDHIAALTILAQAALSSAGRP
jgi:hypothetical protein